jgi:hypothetical protein
MMIKMMIFVNVVMIAIKSSRATSLVKMEHQFNVSEAFCASIHQGMIVMVVKNINISKGRYVK